MAFQIFCNPAALRNTKEMSSEEKTMPRAIWNGAVIAESDHTVELEGNHYFPPDSIRREYFRDSITKTICPWKGTANYYSLDWKGATAHDVAWVYNDPKPAAREIKGHVAFYRNKGVEITS